MPPLLKPEKLEKIDLPPRKGLLAGHADVLVVGGGPAGIGAALGAAYAGARVILAERYGFLGGNATAALVTIWASHHTQTPGPSLKGDASFFPTDHGQGKAVIKGAPEELVRRLAENGGANPPSDATGFTVPFDPEVFKSVALDLLDEAGVDYLFHVMASDVLEGYPRKVVFEGKSGPIVLSTKVLVDATGDGDLAVLAGGEYEVGRPEDGLVQPMTLMFRLDGFVKEAFEAYLRTHPDQWRGVHGLWDLVQKAERDGELELPREDILAFGAPRKGELLLNSTRIINAMGTNVWDLTRAEWEGRRQMRQLMAFFRRYVPGFEKVFVLQSGVQVGVRETRRIMGDYVLTADDILEAAHFDDAIAYGTYPIDVHNPKGKGTLLRRIPAGSYYSIPLRCLIPKNLEQILLAGRCISGTHEAHSSYRVMPICMATGQAAGACAALSCREGVSPREMPAAKVQAELVRQGAL